MYELDGFYKGSLIEILPSSTLESIGKFVLQFWLPWYGKEFNKKAKMGNNLIPGYLSPFLAARFGDKVILKKGEGRIHVFPFKTKITRGIKDKIEVLQLDYDLPENSPFVRSVVDELVYVGNGDYFGRAYFKEGKNHRLVATFRLQK